MIELYWILINCRVVRISQYILTCLLLIILLASCKTRDTSFLTQEEWAWLSKHKGSLDVLFGYEAPPNAYHDEDGNYVGLLVDFLHEIEGQLGIRFNFKKLNTWRELIEDAKTSRNYIIVGIAATDDRKQYLKFTDSFIKVPYVIVTRSSSEKGTLSELFDSRVCTVGSYAVNDYLAMYYPRISTEGVIDNLVGLRAVSTGSCDAMIVNQMYASYLIDNQGITNLKIAGESGYLNRLSAAVSIKDPELFNILDKAVDNIGRNRRQELYQKWITGGPPGLSSSILTSITVIGSGGIVLLMALWLWSLSLKKQVDKQTRQIRLSEKKFRNYVSNAPMGIFVVNDKLESVQTNITLQKMFNLDADELAGMNLVDFLFSGARNNARDYFESIETSANKVVEISIFKRNGKRCFLEVSTVKLSDSLFLGFVADITERKRAEEEKHKLEAQYHRALKMESVGRLAGGVSHDFNNLLTPILGYAQILLEDLDKEDPRRDSVNEILHAGTRAKDIVYQLLAYSRRQTLEYQHVEMNKAVESFVSLLRRTIREDIEIEVNQTHSSLPILADLGQIEQVIMNLAVNAQDAMSNGGKLLIETGLVALDEDYSKVHPEAEPGDYVMLAVSDTGSGMSEKVQEKLFEPFFSTKGEQGTGLGLSIVYGIVKQHGGCINVYSEPEKGTSFKIYLPYTKEGYVEYEQKQERGTDIKGTETIVLAEDNKQVRDFAGLILRRQGYKVIERENGEEALAFLKGESGPLHLLLTDVIMPEMNGRELYGQAVKIHPELKVLYMSGYTDSVIEHHGVLEEGIDFIQKPFTVEILTRKVRDVLDS